MFDMSMFAINGSIAAYLARQFGVETFSQYIIITSFISVFTLLTRGIQTSIADVHSIDSMISTQHSDRGFGIEIQALIFGFKISALWVLFTPLLVWYGTVSIIPTLSATIIPPIASVFAVVVGRLQGLGQFIHWRAALLFATALQVPLVFVADALNSPLSLFILILVIPIAVVAAFEIRFFRPPGMRFREKQLKVSLTPGLISVLAMSATQLPIIYIRHEIPNNQSTPIIVFVYILGLFIGISSTLGFFLLPKFVKEVRLSSKSISRHFMNSIPLILFFLVYFPTGNKVIGLIIGSNFKLRFTLPFVFASFFSSLSWSVYSSLIHERLNKFRLNFVFGISCLVAFEFLIINYFSLQIEVFFIVHSLVALISVFLALFVTK